MPLPTFVIPEGDTHACFVEMGGVTIYIDKTIEGEPVNVDAWITEGKHPVAVEAIPTWGGGE